MSFSEGDHSWCWRGCCEKEPREDDSPSMLEHFKAEVSRLAHLHRLDHSLLGLREALKGAGRG